MRYLRTEVCAWFCFYHAQSCITYYIVNTGVLTKNTYILKGGLVFNEILSKNTYVNNSYVSKKESLQKFFFCLQTVQSRQESVCVVSARENQGHFKASSCGMTKASHYK